MLRTSQTANLHQIAVTHCPITVSPTSSSWEIKKPLVKTKGNLTYNNSKNRLNRFFSLHYFLPFVIVGVVLLHLILLHQHGSNSPLGVLSIYDRVPFYPYFYVKDLFGFFLFVLFFSFFVI